MKWSRMRTETIRSGLRGGGVRTGKWELVREYVGEDRWIVGGAFAVMQMQATGWWMVDDARH